MDIQFGRIRFYGFAVVGIDIETDGFRKVERIGTVPVLSFFRRFLIYFDSRRRRSVILHIANDFAVDDGPVRHGIPVVYFAFDLVNGKDHLCQAANGVVLQRKRSDLAVILHPVGYFEFFIIQARRQQKSRHTCGCS